MAMSVEQLLELDGKIACGPQGDGVTITSVTIGDGLKKDSLKLEIGGSFSDVLVDPRNASNGTVSIGETIFVAEGVDIEQPDKQVFLSKVSETFGIEPKLEDTEETLFRFAEDAEDSVYPLILGAKAYFKLSVKPPSNPKYPPTVFATFWKVPVKENTTTESMKAAFAKLKAKKDAAKKAAEELEKKNAEIFG